MAQIQIQIRSEALRRPSPSLIPEPAIRLSLPPGTAEQHSGLAEAERASWRQIDLARAIKAAENANLCAYRIEIAPNGTISIVVGASAEPAGSRSPCGEPIAPSADAAL